MTTPFKAKREGVLVEVPKDALHININPGINWLIWKEPDYDNWIPDSEFKTIGKLERAIERTKGKDEFRNNGCKLPPGDWQLAGTSDTMSEDDWKGIVEDDGGAYGEVMYRCYTSENVWFQEGMTPTQSGHSLLPDHSKRYAVILKKTK